MMKRLSPDATPAPPRRHDVDDETRDQVSLHALGLLIPSSGGSPTHFPLPMLSAGRELSLEVAVRCRRDHGKRLRRRALPQHVRISITNLQPGVQWRRSECYPHAGFEGTDCPLV